MEARTRRRHSTSVRVTLAERWGDRLWPDPQRDFGIGYREFASLMCDRKIGACFDKRITNIIFSSAK